MELKVDERWGDNKLHFPGCFLCKIKTKLNDTNNHIHPLRSVRMKWFDKRLTYGFLKENPLKNNVEFYLSGEKKIWKPELDFMMQADNNERYH